MHYSDKKNQVLLLQEDLGAHNPFGVLLSCRSWHFFLGFSDNMFVRCVVACISGYQNLRRLLHLYRIYTLVSRMDKGVCVYECITPMSVPMLDIDELLHSCMLDMFGC